jgi:hypothetical protein
MTKIQAWFSNRVKEEVEDANPDEDRGLSFGLIAFSVLFGLYMVIHQASSTGFFTETFGTWEMILLYGFSVYWFTTSALIVLRFKKASRYLDSFGGLIFVTFGIAWLFVVFPFEFTYFTDASPSFLRFPVQWISDGVARVIMVLAFIAHLGFAIVAGILQVSINKARARLQ